VISGEKILVTGASGSIGLPLALHLAKENEVWGVARFSSREQRPAGEPPTVGSRDELDAAGVTTRSIDLGSGDFGDLPHDFTYVLHLSWMRADLAHLEQAIRNNVEGPGLLLQHCRTARAALVMSGMGVYTGNADPWHAYTETDPVGRGATAYAPTSPASKLGVEAVARFCARAFDLPVVIARMNTFMGTTATFPAMHIAAVHEGRSMVAPHDPNPHSPTQLEDMKHQLEPLLDAARTPALVVNWCGDEVVTAQQWVAEAARLSGKKGELVIRPPDPGSPTGTVADPTLRRSITGPCTSDFWASFTELHAAMTRGPE
jgi:nucleoside-diphosphate-sugar epimerase